jgi:predicted RND superfamily exporter protein
MKMTKKGAVMDSLQGFIMGLAGVAVVLAVVLIVLASLSDTARVGGVSTGATTVASNATDTIISKLATVPTWIGIIIVVALAFIVLGFFYMRGQNQM